MQQFPAALFDLDGVIIDSESKYTHFWNEIESIYPTGIPDYAVAIKGTTLETILGNYNSRQIREDITERLHRFQKSMVYEPFPGALDFLQSLKARNIPMALVTSSDHAKMEELFRHIPRIKDLFNVIIDGSMVSRSKPDPQGYNLAADKLDVPYNRCCVFEDSIQGLKAGRAAGGKVVALATTYPRETVEPLADITIDALARFSPQRLLELFQH